MEFLVVLAVLILLDVASWFWGVDSRDFGHDPRSEGRPYRWI